MTQNLLDRSFDPLARVRQALAGFQARKAVVNNDRNLSSVGKDAATKKLQAESDAHRSKVYDDLDLELRLLRNDKRKLEKQAQEADEAEGKRWDMQRLSYLAMEIQSAAKTAPDFNSALVLYDKARQSSDPHVLRAWAGVFPGLVHEKFSHNHSAEVSQLERRAAAELAELTTTPEQAAAKAFGKEIADRALEFANTTEAAALFYGSGGAFSGGNEFSRLRANVAITESYHADQPGREFQKTVEIADASPAAAVGAAAG